MISFIKDVESFLELTVIDDNGDFVSGLSIDYDVIDSSTNISIASGTLSEIGSVYKTSITITSSGQFLVIYNTPSGYENSSETIIVEDTIANQVWEFNSYGDLLERIAGLSQENYRVISPVYDSRGNMTSGTIKIYPTANDTDNDTNAIAVYTVAATYNTLNRTTGYKVTKV